eukprot:TRINITY_DN3538_c0_g1_i1.p1 TRINITY_DN3538_c0_g1~~TRINITY_DN3538_c0_g1_i1.p1  ORF type:complete len:347 (-),score=49.47 TRINITY_DN3538_c0_g1_i1:304-1344(-)
MLYTKLAAKRRTTSQSTEITQSTKRLRVDREEEIRRLQETKTVNRWKRLREHTESSDVTFLVGPDRVPVKAHRCVLAATSEVFHRMFFGGMKESTSTQVLIGDERLSPESFKAFLDLVYTGTTVLNVDSVFGVLDLARMYDFPCLMKLCNVFLLNHLTPANCIEVLHNAEIWKNEGSTKSFHCRKISHRTCKNMYQRILKNCFDVVFLHFFPEIVRLAWGTFLKNTVEAISQDVFFNLPLSMMMQIVKQEVLEIEEIDLFKKVLEWYRKNEEENNIQIFEHIRYGCISMVDLVNHVGPSQVIPITLYVRTLEFHTVKDKSTYPDILSKPRRNKFHVPPSSKRRLWN